MRKYKFFVLLVFLLLLVACSQTEDPKPDPTSEPPSKGIADVERIEVLKLADQPGQVRVAAHFLLPDLCTSLDNVDVQQSGNSFRITVTTIREGNPACAEKVLEIERLIPLSEKTLPPGAYTVVVNDTSSRFELAAGPTPASTDQTVAETEGTAAEESVQPVDQETDTETENETSPLPRTGSDEQDESEEITDDSSTQGDDGSTGDPEPVSDPSACKEKVGFYGDVTVPDDTFFRQGEAFTKVWKLRNEGTCTWGPEYALVFAGGHILNAPLTVSLPSQVAPGEIFELSLDMTAPSQGGTYVSKWLFQDPQGEQFGMGASRQDVIYARIAVGWVTSGGISADSSGGAGQTSQVSCEVGGDPGVEGEILDLINAERISRGLRRLALEDRLVAAARAHSADMACNNFTDHTGSDGSSWRTRVDREGYTASYVAENIYYGGTGRDAFDWWMDSQVHKDNILKANVSEIGVGYVTYPQSRWVRYYTLVFASP